MAENFFIGLIAGIITVISTTSFGLLVLKSNKVRKKK